MVIGLAWGQCDFNSDGQLDSLDILDEVNCILENCFDGSQCDFNGDGYLDIFDICSTVNCIIIGCWQEEDLFTLHSSIIFKDIPAGTFTMGEDEAEYQGPPGSYDAYVHTVSPSKLVPFYQQRRRWYLGSISCAYQYRGLIGNKKYGVLPTFSGVEN